MAELPQEDFVPFPERLEGELDISDFEDGRNSKAMKTSFGSEVEALRKVEDLQWFLTRLGKDARSVLRRIDQSVKALPTVDSGYASATDSPRGKKRKAGEQD